MNATRPAPARCTLLTIALVLLAATTVHADEFWPKVLAGDGGEVVIYQPQIESLEGQRLQSRAAVMVKLADADAPLFGAMWFDARLVTDQDTRMATLESVTVTAARFAGIDDAAVDKLSRYLEQEIPTWDLEFSIDRIIADLADDAEYLAGDAGFRHEPPDIQVRHHPAVLVVIDGDPVFQDLDGPPLEYLVNSAYFMVREPGQQPFYLRGAGMWFTARDIAGPWTVATDLPRAVTDITPQLEAEEAEQAAVAAEDAAAMEVAASRDETPPEIVMATEPTELIVIDGDPDFAPVEGTQLLYLRNTDNDVVMDIASQQYYVLLAGRWYRSASLADGPWTHVEPEDVPDDFAAIPAGSDLAGVLASVAGTQESREAILDTQIPQTAEIDRKTATCTVTYDGDPEFESCAEGVAYARNTDKSVLLIDGVYYCCDEAVWFVSDRPDGPWAVATELPAVIQGLPPECPVYNVKYVHIYDSTPEVVYVGYTPGYYHSYVYHGCVIYGTGWYYRPWYRHHYYPRPVTYGFGVHYNPWTGWGFSYGVSYGWISVGFHWGRSPYRGWGPGGYRSGYRPGYWHGYKPGHRPGRPPGHKPGHKPGYRPGQKPGQLPAGDNMYRKRDDGVKRTGEPSRQDRRRPGASDRKNNVYTDRDGNVYRDRDGNWEKRENGRWESDRQQPETRDQQRDRDQQQRDRSDQQQRDRDQQQLDRSNQQPRDRSNPQQLDRSSPQQRDRSNQQQLDRDRSSRNRGADRQRQAPQQRQRSGGGQRGGGRR